MVDKKPGRCGASLQPATLSGNTRIIMSKQFVPLECNPDVFNELMYSLGVSKTLSFHDVFSIDPDMLGMIPRPVLSVVMAFPVSPQYEEYRLAQDKDIADDYYNTISGSSDEEAIWIKQTIGNACGTMALLHTLVNNVPADLIEKDSPLDKMIKELDKLNAADRIKYLENCAELEKFHTTVANKGSTQAPEANAEVEHHYVCLTKAKKANSLYELDGRRKGPIKLGSLEESDDLLCETSLEKVKEFLTREGESGQFSIIALGPALD